MYIKHLPLIWFYFSYSLWIRCRILWLFPNRLNNFGTQVRKCVDEFPSYKWSTLLFLRVPLWWDLIFGNCFVSLCFECLCSPIVLSDLEGLVDEILAGNWGFVFTVVGMYIYIVERLVILKIHKRRGKEREWRRNEERAQAGASTRMTETLAGACTPRWPRFPLLSLKICNWTLRTLHICKIKLNKWPL